MSLVICSNQDSDSTTTTQAQSIYKPYSFRNALSSNIQLPRNAQVALQSCKYNLDGSVSVGQNSYSFYQYYGETLVRGTNTIENNSTAVPIRTQLTGQLANDQVAELSTTEMAEKIQTSMNNTMLHPNLRDKVVVDVKRNGTSSAFEGYNINYDYFDTANNTIPADAEVIDGFSYTTRNTAAQSKWTYATGVFTSGQLDAGTVPNNRRQVMVGTNSPLSAHNGSFVVNIANVNTAGQNWAVGLTRFCQTFSEMQEIFSPPYYSRTRGGNQTYSNFYCDFLVGRYGDDLVMHHTPRASSIDGSITEKKKICSRKVLYQNQVDAGGVGPDDPYFDAVYNLDTNTSNIDRVQFTLTGEQIRVDLLQVDDTPLLLYKYNVANANTAQYKAVCQSTWNLYPLLYIDANTAQHGQTMTITQFTACTDITDFDITARDASWYQSVEAAGGAAPTDMAVAWELEQRIWNNQAITTRSNYLTYAGLKGAPNDVIDLDNYLIMKPDDLFTPSIGANSTQIMGFEGKTPTNDGAFDGAITTRRVFASPSVPLLLSTRTMFVRLDNFTQSSVNARQGNRSNIIAHLPRFDGQVETGRIYHEAKNLIFLDLNNSEPLNVNSFDISFVYSNEQYVTALTGQSVVVLYWRSKPN